MPDSPLQLTYKSLEAYQVTKRLAVACYGITHELPAEEAANFSRALRMAALQVHIHVAQGASRKKGKKKKKHLRTAKDAIIVIDAALEMLVEVGFATAEEAMPAARLAAACFQLVQAM